MQFARLRTKALAGVAVLVVTSAVASADVLNKKTTMTVKETIEVPGATLEPGEYVVKLVDSQSNRHIVQFLNKEEDKVISMVMAIPNSRLEPTGETEFEWYETPAGQPPALRAWFYPGDSFGQEFAYPESRATELSAATKQEVPHISDEEAAKMAADQERYNKETVAIIAQPAAEQDRDRQTAATTAQQDGDRQTAATTAQRDRETAAQRDRETAAQHERDTQMQRERERQAAQTAQNEQRNADRNLTAQQTPQNQDRDADQNLTAQQSSQNQQRNELPQTAGFGALLALLGLGSLGASRAVRKLRNK